MSKDQIKIPKNDNQWMDHRIPSIGSSHVYVRYYGMKTSNYALRTINRINNTWFPHGIKVYFKS